MGDRKLALRQSSFQEALKRLKAPVFNIIAEMILDAVGEKKTDVVFAMKNERSMMLNLQIDSSRETIVENRVSSCFDTN